MSVTPLLMSEVPDWAEGLFPRMPPLGWEWKGDYVYVQSDRRHMDRLKVLCSARVEADGKRWMHVSVSRPVRLPDWADLKLVKDTFIGDRLALQVLPREAEYVNIHPRCLHLWACLDGDPVPDFRVEGQI